MGGGSVEPGTGAFNFVVTGGYHVEAGKVAHPVKAATPTGTGPDLLRRISMVGRDFASSPDISPVAAMMRALAGAFEDFGPVRVLATGSPQPGSARGLPLAWESIAGTTFEVACARTGPKDRRGSPARSAGGRGQRSL